jgi:hypothetical protein
MRLCYAIICAVLLVGCQSPPGTHDETVRIALALKRRITPDEARHILFDDIDRAIQAAQTHLAAHEDVRTEVAILSSQRQRLSARFDSFFTHSRAGDELWDYRTYVTPEQRGGESGIALVREGIVVGHMKVMIYD